MRPELELNQGDFYYSQGHASFALSHKVHRKASFIGIPRSHDIEECLGYFWSSSGKQPARTKAPDFCAYTLLMELPWKYTPYFGKIYPELMSKLANKPTEWSLAFQAALRKWKQKKSSNVVHTERSHTDGVLLFSLKQAFGRQKICISEKKTTVKKKEGFTIQKSLTSEYYTSNLKTVYKTLMKISIMLITVLTSPGSIYRYKNCKENLFK